MEYRKGYVALIDVLGFSSFVRDETNIEKVSDLFRYFAKFSFLFNSSSKLSVKVSLFSDTLVLTSKEIQKLIIPIYMVEYYLYKNTGMLFRGGITFGKYYHQNGNAFGPAVITAHELESKAKTSRIIIDENIKIENDSGSFIFYFRDVDGYYCINPFLNIFDLTGYQAEEIVEQFYKSIKKEKDRITNDVIAHKNAPEIEKYMWRIRAFNSMCLSLLKIDSEEIFCEENNLRITKELKMKIRALLISEKDYL